MHGENPGCTVLVEMHPVGAHNKTLISDTDVLVAYHMSEKGPGVLGGAKSI